MLFVRLQASHNTELSLSSSHCSWCHYHWLWVMKSSRGSANRAGNRLEASQRSPVTTETTQIAFIPSRFSPTMKALLSFLHHHLRPSCSYARFSPPRALLFAILKYKNVKLTTKQTQEYPKKKTSIVQIVMCDVRRLSQFDAHWARRATNNGKDIAEVLEKKTLQSMSCLICFSWEKQVKTKLVVSKEKYTDAKTDKEHSPTFKTALLQAKYWFLEFLFNWKKKKIQY